MSGKEQLSGSASLPNDKDNLLEPPVSRAAGAAIKCRIRKSQEPSTTRKLPITAVIELRRRIRKARWLGLGQCRGRLDSSNVATLPFRRSTPCGKYLCDSLLPDNTLKVY